MSTAFQLRPGPIFMAKKPIRNPAYRRWIKRFPCIGCGATWGIDPMHTGDHGLGSKSSDMGVLPGCRKCHELFGADPKGFAYKHGLDIPALIVFFNHLWELKQRRTA